MKAFKFETKGHFYASSLGAWGVDEDPVALINSMKADKMSFSLWYVPLPIDADYRIEAYKPDVEGVTLLGRYQQCST